MNLYSKFVLLVFLFLSACFEYEETIQFKKGFSGTVEISYTVPLNNKTEKSVIKSLPITEEEINKRINKGIFNKNLKIRDYSIKILERNEKDISYFVKKAKVAYKLDFNDLSNLDGIIMGSIFVKKRGNSITVKREFKSLIKGLDQNSTPGEKKINSETLRLLGDGFVAFRVNFPNLSECRTNKGDVGLGTLYYKFPLSETIEKPGPKSWDYSITTLY